MTYEELISSVSLVVENDEIYKKNLTLTYVLEPINHKQMQEELFYKANSPLTKIIYVDEFEVEMGSILIKFIKEII